MEQLITVVLLLKKRDIFFQMQKSSVELPQFKTPISVNEEAGTTLAGDTSRAELTFMA
jgi:hypothetical protein